MLSDISIAPEKQVTMQSLFSFATKLQITILIAENQSVSLQNSRDRVEHLEQVEFLV